MDKADQDRFIDRILAGEKNVFRYFIQEYQQMAYAIAFPIVKHHEGAQDAVQNAFVNAYKRLAGFKRMSSFSSWLYRIVVNESIKQARKNKNKEAFIDHSVYDRLEGHALNDAIRTLEIKEIKQSVNEVIALLKPKEALVLTLHYLHEKSLKEIVEITGFSLSNVKVLLFRARKSFMGKYVEKNKNHGG